MVQTKGGLYMYVQLALDSLDQLRRLKHGIAASQDRSLGVRPPEVHV